MEAVQINKIKQNPLKIFVLGILKVFYWVLLIPFFPFYLILTTPKPSKWLRNNQKFYVKLSTKLLALFVLLPLWILFYYRIYWFVDNFAINRKGIIQVSGTGSMYPTFPKGVGTTPEEKANEVTAEPIMLAYPSGFSVAGKTYFKHELQRGDIVSFSNEKTVDIADSEYGIDSFVKRIIGLPGDIVELRDGIVYINSLPLVEPYTSLPHSTFGGEFIPECTQKTIPVGKYFVLGDNRKESNDSRQNLGFISDSDIDYVLTIEMQKGVWDKNYRNTTQDLSPSSKITLDINKFIEILNAQREKNGVSVFSVNEKLNYSALLRAKNIIESSDFSFEGEISGYSMQDALNEAGYFNRTWGEIPIQGYYTEEELINNIFHFDDSTQFVLEEDFQDIGVAVYQGLLNECPTQVIVLHFGGYIPAEYSQDVIKSWKDLLNNLEDIEKSWEELFEYESFYKQNKKDVDRINEIIDIRIEKIKKITTKMENREWLSDDENEYLKQDEVLGAEQTGLAEKINKKVNQ